jgi:hypothetical protein
MSDSCVHQSGLMKSVLFVTLLFVACDVAPVSERRLERDGNPKDDTSVLRAADFAGHDGKKLRNKGAALIDANRKRNQAIEDALQDNNQ